MSHKTELREVPVEVGDATLRCRVAGAERGGAEGPLVICAHGFPDNWDSYSEQIPALVDLGFRVVVPAMRGYAPSSTGRRYDAATLGADLIALADHFSPAEAAIVIGHDWGAIAAYAATALAPERWSHMVTMAVPHLRTAAPRWIRPRQLKRSWYMGMFQLRGIAERRLLRDDMALVERLWRDWSPAHRCSPERLRAVKEAIAAHPSDVLAYYRSMPSPRALAGEARRVVFACTRVPALYIHGEDDGCVGVELCDGMEAAFSADLEVHRLPGAGHFVHLEAADRVNELLRRFLASRARSPTGA